MTMNDCCALLQVPMSLNDSRAVESFLIRSCARLCVRLYYCSTRRPLKRQPPNYHGKRNVNLSATKCRRAAHRCLVTCCTITGLIATTVWECCLFLTTQREAFIMTAP